MGIHDTHAFQLPHTPTVLLSLHVYLAWEIGIVTKFLVEVPSRFTTVKPTYLCSIALHHSMLSGYVKYCREAQLLNMEW